MEEFKTNQSEESALHSTYHVMTGNTLAESDHHLQIDAVSLYLLYLVQMISSGVQVRVIILSCHDREYPGRK